MIMAAKYQHHIAFYLTGRMTGGLRPMTGSYRPALFARLTELSTLRYDFPLLLNREGPHDRSMLSLSRLVDEAIETLAEKPERDQLARHAYELERGIREALSVRGIADCETLWNDTALRMAAQFEGIQDSSKRLWSLLNASGEIVDVDRNLPRRAIHHAWHTYQASKADAFRDKVGRLLLKLRSILEAELASSEVGRAPERLKASVGASFASSFDFDVMSSVLGKTKQASGLSKQRRDRINALINVLQEQRFFPMSPDTVEAYGFSFEHCADALRAYTERRTKAVELLKALAIAELEVHGDYRESVHDVIFQSFGANGLGADEQATLPDYLVCVNSASLDAEEIAQITDALSAGLPIKVLIQTDDILEAADVIEGHVALASRSRRILDMAIGLTDVFVMQSSASHLAQSQDAVLRGLRYHGPAIFSVFSGSNAHTGEIPPYLVAAAAMECRVFPAMVYDPSAGPDWATRLAIDRNPSAQEQWPTHLFEYEDGSLHGHSERVAFTLADFMAMDERFSSHFALIPEEEWNDSIVSLSSAIEKDGKILPSEVASILVVESEGRLHRALVDRRTLQETRRCLGMWRSLQELGGIHNSHVERFLAAQTLAQISNPEIQSETVVATIIEKAGVPEVVVVEEIKSDDPYIETPRCTTCNECTQVNNKMFAYNGNKQAYVADADAGTYRQLVEAAEGCQVSIIHPGKPRNQKEPGLEDLLKRAAAFN